MRLASHLITHVTLAGALLLLSPLAVLAGTPNNHSKFAGVYESDPPAPDTPGSKPTPTMSVSLGSDGTATVSEDPGKGGRTLFGHWSESGSQVTVNFDASKGNPAEPALVLQPSHDGLQAVTWNHSTWGNVKPPLMKKANSSWHGGHHHIF